jgi:HTH-type transcriptional regulator, sugar sensing transcriptional regulator
VQPKLILKDFDKFGLNSYEAKSYLSLLERNRLTAVEVSRIAGIPRAKVYETLENLSSRGFCHTIPGKVKKYSAVSPSALKDIFIQMEREKLEMKLDKLREEIKAKEEELGSKIKSADGLVKKLTPLYEASRSEHDPLEYIEIIKETNQLQNRICQLIDSAEREVLVLSKPPRLEDRDIILQQIDLEKESLKKGVISKCVYEIPKNDDQRKWLYEYITLASGAGEEARVIEQIPIKMMIFDEKVVVFTLEDPLLHKPSTTTQVIEHSSLAKGLKILFQTVWDQAQCNSDLIGNSSNITEADKSKNPGRSGGTSRFLL